MNELDELRQEVLENTDLDINEKMCLIVLLCGSGAGGEREIARLMGATVQTARMALDSLKKKGYLSSAATGSERTVSSERETRRRRTWEDEADFYPDSYDEDGTDGFTEEYPRETVEESYIDPRREMESQRLANYLMSDEKRVEGSGLIKKGSTRASIAQQRYAKSTSQRSNKEREALEQLERAREVFANQKNQGRQVENHQPEDLQTPKFSRESLNERRTVDEFEGEEDFSTFQRNALSDAFTGKSRSAAGRSKRTEVAEQDPKRRPTAKPSTKRTELKSSATREITEEKVQKVMQLMDEALTRPEATIILGFAGGDYEKVERVYERVRRTQIKDKVDALVKLLQSEE